MAALTAGGLSGGAYLCWPEDVPLNLAVWAERPKEQYVWPAYDRLSGWEENWHGWSGRTKPIDLLARNPEVASLSFDDQAKFVAIEAARHIMPLIA